MDLKLSLKHLIFPLKSYNKVPYPVSFFRLLVLLEALRAIFENNGLSK